MLDYTLQKTIDINDKCELSEIQNLIEMGSSINAREPINGYTALHSAVVLGRADIVRLLVETPRTLVDSRNYLGETPLFLALRKNNRNEQIISDLLKNGSQLYFQDNFGEPAYIPPKDSISIINTYNSSQARMTWRLWLTWVNDSNYECVLEAIRQGISPNFCNALKIAKNNNWMAGMKLLLECGADPRVLIES